MRKVRALDKQSGQEIGYITAEDIRERTRRAYDYRCPNKACDCSLHFRRAVYAHENTQYRPATFVKNPSSEHIAGCRFDFPRIQRENHSYSFLDDAGNLHLRINFPLGSTRGDLRPLSGKLTQKQLRAAHNRAHITGISDIEQLVRFIEDNFGTLDDAALDHLYLYYQGESYHWAQLFTGCDAYYDLAMTGRARDSDNMTPPRLCIMAPTHQIAANKNGHPRFACRSRQIHGALEVQPILVIHKQAHALYNSAMAAMQKGQPLLAAGRPFGAPQRSARQHCYLYMTRSEQLALVARDYWHPASHQRRQLAFSF